YPDDEGLFAEGVRVGQEVAAAYEGCDFARAMRAVMTFADRANEYFDRKEPWKLVKQGETQKAQDVCTVALNLYRQMALYLAPVLPQLAEQSAALLGAPLAAWSESEQPLVGQTIKPFQHLMQRVDPKKLEAMIAASKDTTAAAAPAAAAESSYDDDGAALAAEPLAAECTIDDFGKVDLRVARVLAAEELPEAKKLLKLTVSLGGGSTRTIFAGIKSAYQASTLVGRLVVIVANLAPRKMKFGTSEGMVIAAGPGDKDIFVLSPDSGAKPGQRIH
ncbi:MAG TPA: methionine--tRNA ligase subunit beta, partial [Polyangiaceae bacterium]|nr:methionine--tRNA ligase subunit beta [Polyangiaceae bacterium]